MSDQELSQDTSQSTSSKETKLKSFATEYNALLQKYQYVIKAKLKATDQGIIPFLEVSDALPVEDKKPETSVVDKAQS